MQSIPDRFRQAAKKIWQREGSIEVDDNAVVSISDDNGAYVQAWVWVDDAEIDFRRET